MMRAALVPAGCCLPPPRTDDSLPPRRCRRLGRRAPVLHPCHAVMLPATNVLPPFPKLTLCCSMLSSQAHYPVCKPHTCQPPPESAQPPGHPPAACTLARPLSSSWSGIASGYPCTTPESTAAPFCQSRCSCLQDRLVKINAGGSFEGEGRAS